MAERGTAALAHLAARLGGLLRRPMPFGPTAGWILGCCRLSAEAREMPWAFYLQTEKAQAEGGKLAEIRPFTSKAPSSLSPCRGDDPLRGSGGVAVTDTTMRDALTLATFYLNEALRLAREATVSAETAEAERMRRWLVGKWSEHFISARRTPFSADRSRTWQGSGERWPV